MKKKNVIGLILGLLVLASMSVTQIAARGSGSGSDNNGNAKVTMKIAHNLAADHPWGIALEEFAKLLASESNNSITAKVFHNGTLGSETELLEQAQKGIIDIVRASAATLANIDNCYTAFTLPYLFRDEDDFYSKMASITGKYLFDAAADNGLMTLAAFNGGIRSFYTVSKPIMKPSDLAGLKIRVMGNPTQIKMVELLGGTPIPMAYGEIYTSLQQGILDGAENNPTALTLSRHGEVAKFYSYDRHGFIPDFVVISKKTWEKLSESQKQAVKSAINKTVTIHKKLWNEAVEESKKEAASKLNVQFFEPDQQPFKDAMQPIYEEYSKDQEVKKYLDLLK